VLTPIKTVCPVCRNRLEFSVDADTVICSSCGNTFRVSRREGGIALARIDPEAESVALSSDRTETLSTVIDERLTEVDELLEEAEAEVEAVRSREQSGPLRAGCSLFALFFAVLLVIILFGLLGREYVGGKLFYLALAVIIVVGLFRIRAKLSDQEEVERLKRTREEMETALAGLRTERDRLAELKSRLSEDDEPSADRD